MRKFVWLVALGVLTWIFVVPSCSTKFGCESAAAVANADSGSCPSDVDDAADDAGWAAARLETIKDKKPTIGLFYDSDGTELEFDSTKDDAAKRALQVGRDAKVFPPSGRPYVVDHVEVKVVAAMRDSDETEGVLVINNSRGPCYGSHPRDPERMTCQSFLPRLLRPGATLTVWWPDPDGGTPHKQTFTGASQ